MPEIDKDLFQALSLALLLITVIVLLAILSTLSRVSKLLKEQLAPSKDRSLDLAAPLETSEVSESQEDLEDEVEPEFPLLASPPLGDSEHEPMADASSESTPADHTLGDDWGSSSAGSPEPAVRGDESGADAFAGLADTPEAETSAAESSSEAVDPFTGETASPSTTGADQDDPFASQPVAASGIAQENEPFASQPAATSEGAGDEPFTSGTESSVEAVASGDEEQPFELNGRWYFRRDEELLVYDEGTGEWVAAQEEEQGSSPSWDGPGSVAPAETSAFGESDAGSDETAQFDSVEQAVSEEPAAAGGFWKCPSCGAVNGSSASTCRMCFAARP